MSTIQVRTDASLKKNAQRILKDMGLDLITAVNMYLHQIVATESIPFSIQTENKFTLLQELKMLAEEREALKYGKRYDSVDELFTDLMNDDEENEPGTATLQGDKNQAV